MAMTHDRLPSRLHPADDQLPVEPSAAGSQTLDTFGGPVEVDWDPSSALTPLGQLVYFAAFLKVSGRFDAAVADCPLTYTSPNAPEVRDVAGTWVLSALAGHKRYAHVTTLRCDQVLPELLGMTKIVSEDSLRHGLAAIPEREGLDWLEGHLDATTPCSSHHSSYRWRSARSTRKLSASPSSIVIAPPSCLHVFDMARTCSTS